MPPTEAELAALESRLQELLDAYRDRLEPVEVYGQPFLRRPGATKHEWFAGVNRGKGVVRLSLLPMYHHPELLDGVSPALQKRRSGASVFTFTSIDDAQLAELEALLGRAWDRYAGKGAA
ncbi:MAG TPA: hypothetical protein VID95_01605 [Candidatus Limnocylindrales bacterium]